MIELLHLWQLQSVNVAAEQNVNSLLIAYVILSLIINRPALLLVYLSSEMLYQLSVFDFLLEWQLFAIECIMYSYVFTTLTSIKSKSACAVLFSIALYFIYDAHKYGATENYEGYQTILYKNIECIFTCAHIIFISSFVSIERIRNNIRNFVNSIGRIALNSDYMFFCWYNIYKIQSTKQKT
tara:strand:- start:7608 stop:8153 length:546 start_codon:yes stop_codon:yes gene_type:complete